MRAFGFGELLWEILVFLMAVVCGASSHRCYPFFGRFLFHYFFSFVLPFPSHHLLSNRTGSVLLVRSIHRPHTGILREGEIFLVKKDFLV